MKLRLVLDGLSPAPLLDLSSHGQMSIWQFVLPEFDIVFLKLLIIESSVRIKINSVPERILYVHYFYRYEKSFYVLSLRSCQGLT